MRAANPFLPALAACLLLLVTLHAGHAEASPRRELQGKVNLNAATVAELDLLPGVGLSMAERIVAYRQQQPFRRTEELVRIRGVGRKKYLRLAPYLSVDGPTTLTLKEPERSRVGKEASGSVTRGRGPPGRS